MVIFRLLCSFVTDGELKAHASSEITSMVTEYGLGNSSNLAPVISQSDNASNALQAPPSTIGIMFDGRYIVHSITAKQSFVDDKRSKSSA